MNESEVKSGTVATAKIGRNEVEVTVIETIAGGWKVKSNSSGREFEVRRLERIIGEPSVLASAPEVSRAEKKLSLLDAAARILEQNEIPLNCKEMIAKAVNAGLWTPTAAKTPEQSLYSAIFREINGKEKPRFRKSAERRGAFEFIR